MKIVHTPNILIINIKKTSLLLNFSQKLTGLQNVAYKPLLIVNTGCSAMWLKIRKKVQDNSDVNRTFKKH